MQSVEDNPTVNIWLTGPLSSQTLNYFPLALLTQNDGGYNTQSNNVQVPEGVENGAPYAIFIQSTSNPSVFGISDIVFVVDDYPPPPPAILPPPPSPILSVQSPPPDTLSPPIVVVPPILVRKPVEGAVCTVGELITGDPLLTYQEPSLSQQPQTMAVTTPYSIRLHCP